MNSIDNNCFINQKKEPKKIYLFTIIITIIVITTITICHFIHLKINYHNEIIVDYQNSQYLKKIIIPSHEVKYLLENNVLIINQQEYPYKVLSVDNTSTYNNCVTVIIKSSELEKFQVNKLILPFTIKVEKETIIKYLTKIF